VWVAASVSCIVAIGHSSSGVAAKPQAGQTISADAPPPHTRRSSSIPSFSSLRLLRLCEKHASRTPSTDNSLAKTRRRQDKKLAWSAGGNLTIKAGVRTTEAG
jgi:hypothetical protein